MYYVYVHTVPNGKIYIGQTNDFVRRWNNGVGYIENRQFYKDIQKYGWNNIKHEIIASFEDREDAEKLEIALIVLLQSENAEFGYNQTHIYNTALKKYASRVPNTNANLKPIETVKDDLLFESFNLPKSACEELINQWIFNEKYRKIIKSRFLDGLTFAELSELYNLSIRQIKYIVYSNMDKIRNRLV